MKKWTVNELRELYLSFFESKDHLRLKSFSLIPHNDNSLLLFSFFINNAIFLAMLSPEVET